MIKNLQPSFQNSIKTYKFTQNYKYSQPIKDTISLSFKGKNDDFDDDEMSLPVMDFVVKMKAKSDSKQIVKNTKEIKKASSSEYKRAMSVIATEEKKILSGRLSRDNDIERTDGKSLYKSYSYGKLRRVTHFSQEGQKVLINQVDVYNSNGSLDIIVADENNNVKLVRKDVRHIGPKSYLEDKVYTYRNDGTLEFYYDSSSKINDGVAKSKTEKKYNVHKFEHGQLSYFIPVATYSGNDLHYDKKYIFKDGDIKTYMVDVDVVRGEDEPKKRYDF